MIVLPHPLPQDPDLPAMAGEDFGNVTAVHPIGVAALSVLAVLAILLPRRMAAIPFVTLLCFIPAGQRVILFTLDFTFIRVLILVMWTRLLVRRELRPLLWNHLDRAFVLWNVTAVLFGTVLTATLTGFVNRMGAAVDAMAIYFFFRILLRSHQDLIRLAMQFALLGVVVLLFFAFENRTQRNMFYIFGGVPEFTDIRDGRLRCQGAFAHPILAGCFWAGLIPLYLVRGWLGQGWRIPILGTIAALGIVALCASSTPVMAVLFGVMGGGLFLVRGALRWYRWLAVAWLLVLHFILMKNPVWHLLARVDVVGGSTGWHRFHLVDEFFNRFTEWWMLGTLTTAHWGPGLHDVTNQYVAEGVYGGLARLVAFLLLLWFAFAGISRSMRAPTVPIHVKYAVWALGTAMFMHCANYIAVSYFEQITALWYITLAAIASLTLVPGAAVRRQLAAGARGDEGLALA